MQAEAALKLFWLARQVAVSYVSSNTTVTSEPCHSSTGVSAAAIRPSYTREGGARFGGSVRSIFPSFKNLTE